MNVIDIKAVSKYFGTKKAVNNLSLTVKSGEIFGFLGTNGAGKTTTIKMLLGLTPPDHGTITIFNLSPCDSRVRARIGFMPETAYYYPYLNLYELLRFYGGLCGLDHAECDRRATSLITELDLQAAAKRPLKTYSKGMLQRAGIAQALLHDPDLLILDEPLTGLDPLARIQLRNLLVRLRERGKTVFFSSHELTEAELISDRVAIIKDGEAIMCGQVAVLAGDGSQNLERIFLNALTPQTSQEHWA